MNIFVEKNYDDVSKRAADIVAEQIKTKSDSVLGLATGSSPIGMYENLVKMYDDGKISFKNIKTVNLDEYVGLEPTDVNSYRYFMNHHLFSKVDIDIDNTHVPNGVAKDANSECDKYSKMTRELGVDLQVLGLGENGHIGFNEPGTPFDQETHVVNLTESTIKANSRLFDKEEDVPRQAISMGIKNIMDAKKIILIVTGQQKADALAKVINGPLTPEVPGSVLGLHHEVTVICDEAAASKL